MNQAEYAYLAKMAHVYPNGDILVAGTEYGEDVRTFMRTDPDRNIIVVDSFQGLAPPVKQDMKDGVDYMKEGECNIGGLEVYLEKFKEAGMVPPKEIYQMWITEEELKKIPPRPIAILFLDLDHYAPTKACLDVFGQAVVDNGGVIIVHDYDFERCPGIKKCCNEFGGHWEKIKDTGFGRHYPLASSSR